MLVSAQSLDNYLKRMVMSINTNKIKNMRVEWTASSSDYGFVINFRLIYQNTLSALNGAVINSSTHHYSLSEAGLHEGLLNTSLATVITSRERLVPKIFKYILKCFILLSVLMGSFLSLGYLLYHYSNPEFALGVPKYALGVLFGLALPLNLIATTGIPLVLTYWAVESLFSWNNQHKGVAYLVDHLTRYDLMRFLDGLNAQEIERLAQTLKDSSESPLATSAIPQPSSVVAAPPLPLGYVSDGYGSDVDGLGASGHA